MKKYICFLAAAFTTSAANADSSYTLAYQSLDTTLSAGGVSASGDGTGLSFGWSTILDDWGVVGSFLGQLALLALQLIVLTQLVWEQVIKLVTHWTKQMALALGYYSGLVILCQTAMPLSAVQLIPTITIISL